MSLLFSFIAGWVGLGWLVVSRAAADRRDLHRSLMGLAVAIACMISAIYVMEFIP